MDLIVAFLITDVQVNQIIEYKENYPSELQIFNNKYLLPSDCRFLLSDWNQLLNLHIVGNPFFTIICC